LAQALQVFLQHLAQAPSAAVAVASPNPAMMASMAPALISVFMGCFLCRVVAVGIHSRPECDSPRCGKSPRKNHTIFKSPGFRGVISLPEKGSGFVIVDQRPRD
jgi:acyl-CoA synthetase (AMP-forming)/AMP-acid ligase II